MDGGPLDGADDRALEMVRQRSGLSIDLEGRLLHRGEPITHPRTLELLWRSLERGSDGRYLVRIGRESGYVRLEDAPYVVRGVAPGIGEVRLSLSDGSQELLRPGTLTVDCDGVLHCIVKEAHRARFSRAAQAALGLLVEEDGSAPAGYALVLPGGRWPIGSE
jgi:hypothetical protein